jgi:hypothetical protein
MANSKKNSGKNMDYKRIGDKQNTINLIITVASFLILLVFTYVIGTMSNRMSRIEAQQDKFINYYIECKDEINQLRTEYADNLSKFKDQIIKLFKKS